HPRAKELFNRDKLPAFHDPFAGGGALPLEAQRLGLEAYASDLNPVAVLINKAMIEIPPKFACIFRRKLDGDSDGNWTPIPTETGHGFRRKVDGDSERKWYTFERGLGISTRALQRDVRGAG